MVRVQANCDFSLSSLEDDGINETEKITKYLQVSNVNQCHLSIHPSIHPSILCIMRNEISASVHQACKSLCQNVML
jgi:hypothetical protein